MEHLKIKTRRKRERLLKYIIDNDDCWEKLERILLSSLPSEEAKGLLLDEGPTPYKNVDEIEIQQMAQEIEARIVKADEPSLENFEDSLAPGQNTTTVTKGPTPASSQIPSTYANLMNTSTESSSSSEGDGEWQKAQQKHRKKKRKLTNSPASLTRKASSIPTPLMEVVIPPNLESNKPVRARHHIDPLVIEGLSEDLKRNTIRLKRSLPGLKIHKIVRTRNDVVLVFPDDLETKTALLNKKNPPWNHHQDHQAQNEW
jgi:hypothetical protein